MGVTVQNKVARFLWLTVYYNNYYYTVSPNLIHFAIFNVSCIGGLV